MKDYFRQNLTIFFMYLYKRFFEYKFLLLPRKGITYSQDLLITYNNCDFIKDKRFAEAYESGKRTDIHNLMGGSDIHWRVHVLCWAAQNVSNLDGDFVECGVNTGIFSRAIVQYLQFEKLDKSFYLLDTFKGLDPKYSTSKEIEKTKTQNYFDVYENAKLTFSTYPNVKLIKGSIPETLCQVDTNKIAFLSIDMNSVLPEIEALEYFWDKLVFGGIIILDDYGYGNQYMEQKHAHDEFAKRRGVQILTLPTCQGLIIKNK